MKEYVARLSESERKEIAAAGEMIDVALMLGQARRHRGLSQREAARRAGMHQQAVSRIESPGAGTVRLDTLKRYPDALGYDVELVMRDRAASYDPEG